MDGVYSALRSTQHIRVLILAPSEDVDAALECSLEQQHINDSSKEYEAISYTWGDQERNQPLRCDGAIINITSNLASALLCLRSQTEPRRLWADALCINQDDLVEKAQQVPLMAKIFRYAMQVRVWLGHGDGGESRALADLALWAKNLRPRTSSLDPSASQNYDPEKVQAIISMGRSAKSILRLPWFGRRWVVQELVLNESVIFHCGKSRVSWPALHCAFHALPDTVWDDDLDIQIRRKLWQLGDLWKTWCFADSSAISCGIYSLLHSFHDLQCQEGKDRLYAITGLTNDIVLEIQPSMSPAIIASISPDYGIRDDQVSQDLAFKMIQSGKVFSTLAHAGASRFMEAERSLASWALDVRQTKSWPLIATERNDDFKLVESCQSLNGILILKITVYGWAWDESWFGTLNDILPLTRELWKRFFPNSFWDILDSRFRYSEIDFRPLSVKKVFEPPEDWIEQRSFNTILDTITKWLYKTLGCSNRFTRVLWVYTHSHSVPSFLSNIAHILWSIARSQAWTEDGHESFKYFPSLREWQSQVGGRLELSKQCLGYLNRGLSTRTIYVGQRTWDFQNSAWMFLFGFGPSDLKQRDVILLPSRESEGGTALFLRPEDTEHKVVGGGLVWKYIAGKSLCGRFVPKDIEIRLS